MKIRYSVAFIRSSRLALWSFTGSLLTLTNSVLGQTAPVRVPAMVQQPEEDYTWWYATLFILAAALAGAIFWALKNRKAREAEVQSGDQRKKNRAKDENWDKEPVDAEKELEWFRRHKKTVGGSVKKRPKKTLAENLPNTSKVLSKAGGSNNESAEFTESELREKLQNLKFEQLPILKFTKIELARPFSALSISNDDALMSAIEQTYDEFEEDEEIRDLAVRILQRFKTRNSVEALAQVALYDISSSIRSKAVSVLADFDHESVFESILLCCADPTREVRAAAARGLFRLSFDRADAWSRIYETNDEYRMKQAALAAKEADLVKRSFDRLVHHDQKIAYEAVALLALMVRAGETAEIFEAIETHNDSKVKLALIHVVGLVRDEETLPLLYGLLEKPIAKDLKDKIDNVIESFEMIPA